MRAAKRLARTGAGTAHGMASLTTALAAGGPSPAPDEGCRRRVPSLRGGFQIDDDLVHRCRMLPGEPALLEDALHRLGHVEPRAAQGGVERHDAVVEQPAHEARGLVPGEIIQNQQHPQRRQLSPQREALRQARLPALPVRSVLLSADRHRRGGQRLQDRSQFRL